MAFAGKNVVVIGANGQIGQGAVFHFLKDGAKVVAVVRDAKKIDAFKAKLKNVENLVTVEGRLDTEENATILKDAVLTALGKDRHIDHIVIALSMGHVNTTGPTTSDLGFVRHAVHQGFESIFISAKIFIPLLKNREGSTFTLTSGGLAHFTPNPSFWALTLRNNMVNGFHLGLAKETENDKVRVNNICIHTGVAELGSTEHKFGFPSVDTADFGRVFTTVAAGTGKGKQYCVTSLADIDKTNA